MRLAWRIGVVTAFALTTIVALVPAARACTPVRRESVRDFPADQLFLLGTIGERTSGGREFDVERSWNGTVPSATILIHFEEAKPPAACGMTVVAGSRVLIAPYRDAGPLQVNLATLILDPESADGQRFLAEAVSVFGPGVTPPANVNPREGVDDRAVAALGLVVGVVLVLVVVFRRPRRPSAPG